jgi:hypothetical protein
MLSPVLCLSEAQQWLAKTDTVLEAHGPESCQALVHVRRTFRPVPDEQAYLRAFFRANGMPCQQARHLAARVQTSCVGLYMVCQPPVQLTLQHHILFPREMARDRLDLQRMSGPVLPRNPIAPADHADQLAVYIDQRDGYTVHLGLNPQIASAFKPGLNVCLVWQFGEAGVRDGVCDRAASCL